MSEVKQTLGVKDTKELFVGVISLAAVLATRLKDGAQVADAVAIMDMLKNDAEFKAKLEAARDGVQNVKGEIADLTVMEGFELMQAAVPELKKLLEALKK